MCQKEALELIVGAFAVIKGASLDTEGGRREKENWASDDLVTPINYAFLGPTLRFLFVRK